MRLFRTNAVCPRCGKHLYTTDVYGYSFTCNYCDENFYSIEVRKVDSETLIISIPMSAESYKENQRKLENIFKIYDCDFLGFNYLCNTMDIGWDLFKIPEKDRVFPDSNVMYGIAKMLDKEFASCKPDSVTLSKLMDLLRNSVHHIENMEDGKDVLEELDLALAVDSIPSDRDELIRLLNIAIKHIENFEEDMACVVLDNIGFLDEELREIKSEAVSDINFSDINPEDMKNTFMVKNRILHNGGIIWELSFEGNAYIFSDQKENGAAPGGFVAENVPFKNFPHYYYRMNKGHGEIFYYGYAWYGPDENYMRDFSSLEECLDWLAPKVVWDTEIVQDPKPADNDTHLVCDACREAYKVQDPEPADDDTYYVCKICHEEIADDEECLWGHIQRCHEDVFEEVQNWETPTMLEEYYQEKIVKEEK